MIELKKLNTWINTYEKINQTQPTLHEIKNKIKELINSKSKVTQIKKMYFRDCKWSNYYGLRDYLISDSEFVAEYKNVDLKAYINDALAWSEKGNLSTELGWLLTLKNWIRNSKQEGRLKVRQMAVQKENVGHKNY